MLPIPLLFIAGVYVFISMMGYVNGLIAVNTNTNVVIVLVLTRLHAVLRNCPLVLLLLPKSFFLKATTPVKILNMLPWLHKYPEPLKAVVLRDGFLFGFHLPSFSGTGCRIFPNLPSVSIHLSVVCEKSDKELQAGRIAGQFSTPPFMNFRVLPLGIVPKKEPNSFRLIHHLSFPIGFSLNDDIDSSWCSVQYSSFDDALFKIRNVGSSALLAKADIQSVFRLLPIHPSAFNSLGFYFQNEFYFNKCLPMGCSLFFVIILNCFLHLLNGLLVFVRVLMIYCII